MKKILSIALVTVIAASMAFAGLTGEGKLEYKYDFDSKDTGFANGTKLVFDVDFATAEAEKIAEGDTVWAQIGAKIGLRLYNGEKGFADGGFDAPTSWAKGLVYVDDIKASINGANWSVDILGMPDRVDLAKSAIDKDTIKKEKDDYGFEKKDYDDPWTYKVGFVKAPGFGVTYNGFTAGLGFFYNHEDDVKDEEITKGKGTDFAMVLSTPEIKLLNDQLSLQAGFSYYQNETAIGKAKTTYKYGEPTGEYKTDRGSAIGGSLAVGYSGDIVEAKIAADMGYAIKAYDATAATYAGVVRNKDKEKFGMDITANVAVSPVTIDMYYKFDGTKTEAVDANYLSAQVGVDLNAFGVPMTLTVYGKDLARPVATISTDAPSTEMEEIFGKFTKGSEYGIKTSVTPLEALKLDASFGFNATSVPNKIGEDNTPKEYKYFSWNASVGAEYTMDIATFSGKVSMKNAGFKGDMDTSEKDYEKAYKNAVNAVVLGLEVEAKTEALIPGAELSLKYAADDLLGSYNDAYRAAEELSEFGSVTAGCKISF